MLDKENSASAAAPINIKDARALYYLLDRLCEHEEATVESCTLDGELLRNDAMSAIEVRRARRVWRRAQRIMAALDPLIDWPSTPLNVGVKGSELVIRIGVETLAFAFESGEENQPFDDAANDFRREWKVTDKYKFAEGVARALRDESEDGSTALTRILDAAFTRAVENDMGVEEDGRLVTAEMLRG